MPQPPTGLQLYATAKEFIDTGSSPTAAVTELLILGVPRAQAEAVVETILQKQQRLEWKEAVAQCVQDGMTTEEVTSALAKSGQQTDVVAGVVDEVRKEREIDKGWRLARRENLITFLITLPLVCVGMVAMFWLLDAGVSRWLARIICIAGMAILFAIGVLVRIVLDELKKRWGGAKSIQEDQ